MRREKKANIAVPVDDTISVPTNRFPFVSESTDQSVSKLFLAQIGDVCRTMLIILHDINFIIITLVNRHLLCDIDYENN